MRDPTCRWVKRWRVQVSSLPSSPEVPLMAVTGCTSAGCDSPDHGGVPLRSSVSCLSRSTCVGIGSERGRPWDPARGQGFTGRWHRAIGNGCGAGCGMQDAGCGTLPLGQIPPLLCGMWSIARVHGLRDVDSIRSTRERALRGSRRCIHRTCRATKNQFGLSQNFPKLSSMPKQSTFPASYRPDIRRGRAHRPPREGC